MTSRRGRRLATVSLLAGVFLAAPLPSLALAAPERDIAVTAKATIRVPNDLATIGIGVKRERRTRGAALRATSVELRRVIVAAQRVEGVGPGDIVTGRVSVRPVRRGAVTVYRGREGAKVTLHEPGNSGPLLAKALAAGAGGFSGPFFSVGDEEEAFGKVLSAAFDKARQRATILADESGLKLGKPIVIEEGEGRLYSPGGRFSGSFFEEGATEVFHAEAAPVLAPPRVAPPPPTKPGRSTVRATVHVVFELLDG